MDRRLTAGAALAAVLAFALLLPSAGTTEARRPTPTPTPAPTPPPAAAEVSIYGAWHCSDDFCTWGRDRPIPDFDSQNHWLIDRGDGRPSVNLVILSFVNPLKLLDGTDDATTVDGHPIGMTKAIVDYFTAHHIRVMVSIGGITYTDDWTTALGRDATQLGLNAAALATDLGVGVEIDYEGNTSPNLVGLEAFIRAYRSVYPYNPANLDPRARLTIDLAAGDRWLIDLTQKATADWLRIEGQTPAQDPAIALDYANAMVPARQPDATKAIANWQEHLDGKAQYAPPIPPLAPARLTGSVYVAEGSQIRPECNSFASSLQRSTGSFVRTAGSRVPGGTSGMLGFMFWAAEKPSTRGVGTQPPNTCEGGMGVGASTYTIPIPMPALRTK